MSSGDGGDDEGNVYTLIQGEGDKKKAAQDAIESILDDPYRECTLRLGLTTSDMIQTGGVVTTMTLLAMQLIRVAQIYTSADEQGIRENLAKFIDVACDEAFSNSDDIDGNK